MVVRFCVVGVVRDIDTLNANDRYGYVHLQVEDDVFTLVLQGKLLSLITDSKLKIGDVLFSEGRLIKSKSLHSQVHNHALVLFNASYINVVS